MTRNVVRRIATLRGRGPAELLYAGLWRLGARLAAPARVQRAVFTRICERNEWGDPESRSGPGSTRARGEEIAGPLADLFHRFSIATLLDAPCGDFNWMRDVTGTLEAYVGVDVVPELIASNDARYGDPRHRFRCRDITRDDLPAADAILCRDALVHLSDQDIRATLRTFRRSGSTYLLTTSFAALRENGAASEGPSRVRASIFSMSASWLQSLCN